MLARNLIFKSRIQLLKYYFNHFLLSFISAANGLQQAETALAYVERVRNSPCTGGTDEVLPVQFDHAMWYQYADVAVRMANLLTKVLIHNNNHFLPSQEEFLYDLVRNNVDSDSLIFGSAIAVSIRPVKIM